LMMDTQKQLDIWLGVLKVIFLPAQALMGVHVSGEEIKPMDSSILHVFSSYRIIRMK